MSSEEQRAWRMARLYRRLGCLALPRAERIAAAQRRLAEAKIEQAAAHEHAEAEHAKNCDECRSGDGYHICLWRLTSWHSKVPGDEDLDHEMSALRVAIALEEHDEIYRNEAVQNGVYYRDHVDGFCAYWQNLRARRFELADWRCERCGMRPDQSLELHHLDYRHLGFEELDDVRALCCGCHEREFARSSSPSNSIRESSRD